MFATNDFPALLYLPWQVCVLTHVCHEMFVYFFRFAIRGLTTCIIVDMIGLSTLSCFTVEVWLFYHVCHEMVGCCFVNHETFFYFIMFAMRGLTYETFELREVYLPLLCSRWDICLLYQYVMRGVFTLSCLPWEVCWFILFVMRDLAALSSFPWKVWLLYHLCYKRLDFCTIIADFYYVCHKKFDCVIIFAIRCVTALSRLPCELWLLFHVCHDRFHFFIMFVMRGLTALSRFPWEVWLLYHVCHERFDCFITFCHERFDCFITFAMRGLIALSCLLWEV
jgi:hypothetical protein